MLNQPLPGTSPAAAHEYVAPVTEQSGSSRLLSDLLGFLGRHPWWSAVGVLVLLGSLKASCDASTTEDSTGPPQESTSPPRQATSRAADAARTPAVRKLPLEMTWREAEAFMKARGMTDIRQGRDTTSLRGANPGARHKELIVFDFAEPFSDQPPLCVGVSWFAPGDWRTAITEFSGADPAGVPKEAESGKQAFALETPRETIWVRLESNPLVGGGVAGLSIGPQCPYMHE